MHFFFLFFTFLGVKPKQFLNVYFSLVMEWKNQLFSLLFHRWLALKFMDAAHVYGWENLAFSLQKHTAESSSRLWFLM